MNVFSRITVSFIARSNHSVERLKKNHEKCLFKSEEGLNIMPFRLSTVLSVIPGILT